MTENTKPSNGQEKKINKSVGISGIIFGIAVMITGVFAISKAVQGASMAPDMVIAGSAWSLLVMPIALAVFIICLLWNNTKDGKQFTVKTIITVIIMFFFMLYFMFAVLMVWIVKVDNTPAEHITETGVIENVQSALDTPETEEAI